MKTILILGAGRSSSYLIEYLLANATTYDWEILVADMSLKLAQQKINSHIKGTAIQLDIESQEDLEKLIERSSIVVSLLPPVLHIKAAINCLKYGKSLITASYLSEEMLAMNSQVQSKGLLFLNEMGLDPGIDHMSAMEIINRLQAEGKKIISFKSFCGGLIAPESDNNPWGYKFTWNPKNIVLAGQGTAKFLEDGTLKYIPYHQLFKRIDTFYFPKLGEYKGYVNRDSLKYQEAYGLSDVKTLIRGTLRKPGFCKAWDVFVQLGMTDDSYIFTFNNKISKKEFLRSFLPVSTLPTRKNLAQYLNLALDDEALVKIGWLGFFEDDKLNTEPTSPANILLYILQEKWALKPGDKDMVLMQHQIGYEEMGKQKSVISSLVEFGKDADKTAMARTVGLPAAIATKLMLLKKINLCGVLIPTHKEIYEPIMQELREAGIRFKEEIKD